MDLVRCKEAFAFVLRYIRPCGFGRLSRQLVTKPVEEARNKADFPVLRSLSLTERLAQANVVMLGTYEFEDSEVAELVGASGASQPCGADFLGSSAT